MNTNIKFVKRFTNTLTAMALLASSILPAMLFGSTAQAAQLTSRSLTMTNSKVGAQSPSATYTLTFTHATSFTSKGYAVFFCTSALINTTCTAPTGLALTAATQNINSTSYTVGGSGNGWNFNNATGVAVTAGSTSSSIVFTVTSNPTTAGTYYARVTTYSSETVASGITSATSLGAYTDNGSVAFAATNDLTVNGIVTETLDFCVGAAANGAGASTAAIQTCATAGFSSAATVGLGVIGSTLTKTPNGTSNGGTDTNGAFLIRTNAVNGATVGYKSNQNVSSGTLKITGATCSGSVKTDACINAAGTTQTALSSEGFGMTLTQRLSPDSKTGSGTSNLTFDAQYDNSPSDQFAWDASGSYDQIASSSTVMDYELAIMTFGALVSPTTPSGAYTVSANFVATATY